MPSPSERQRNNMKAGVFVSIALILALLVIIVLTDAIEKLRQRTNSYTVVFDVASGVPNLKRGSEVRVGGLRLGAVTKIDPRLAEGTKMLREIGVEFNLDEKAQLYNNAQIFVSAPLIGADAWLDIPSVGTLDSGEAHGEITGSSSAGFLTSLLGGENKIRTEQIVANAVTFSDFLAAIPGEYDSRIIPVIDDLKATSGDVRAVINDFQERHWPVWSKSVDDIMAWAVGVPPKIDEAVAQGTGLLTDSRQVIAENRQQIHSVVTNVDEATAKINNETIDKVHTLLDTGQEGLDSAVATLKNLQVDYNQWATDAGEALGSATIAAQQLKLATIEVRRSPWKLLYRPTADELEHELLYEAARSFAVAASDVKAAAASVQRTIDSNQADTLRDAESFHRLQQSLLDSLERYEKAQQQLLDVIIADQKQ